MDRSAALDAIRACLESGAPWAASDVFRSAVEAGHDDPELTYWGALAHARAGAVGRARELLQGLLDEEVAPPLRREALCLSGRLWKDRFGRAQTFGVTEIAAITASHAEYAAAYAIDADPFPGVNAATTAWLAGRPDVARSIATRVEAGLSDRPAPLDAWAEASRAEALLLLGRVDESRDAYARVHALVPDAFGTLATMRRQLGLIARVIPEAAAIRDSFQVPVVAGFAGHMIDREDRTEPRFPAWMEASVSAALRAAVTRWKKPIIYTSAACGSDILFIEAALEVDAEVNVVLPFDREDFVRASVAIAGDAWVARFDAALARATRVIFATDERYLGDDLLFEHAQRLVGGLTTLRARQLDVKPTMLFVIDEEAPAFVGGTRDELERWRRREATNETIDLAALRRRTTRPEATVVRGSVAPRPYDAPDWTERLGRTLKIMLFADVAGFSRVHDLNAPAFHQRFLGTVAAQIAECAAPPLEANTWGDALYLVFENAVDAATFALGMLDKMRAADWVATGLAEGSGVRIALHAGPVFCGFDPIIERDNYFGSGTTAAARIEPITPPGVVYASETFAATLASAGSTPFDCEYVGELALAKGYGSLRIYRIERS